jgi:hypothetical protein
MPKRTKPIRRKPISPPPLVEPSKRIDLKREPLQKPITTHADPKE